MYRINENFNSTNFIKICFFTLLIWIIHYNNNINNCNRLFDKNYELDVDLDLTTNRLLAHHSVNEILLDKEDIQENEKDTLLQNKELKGRELNRNAWDKVAKSNNSSLFSRLDTFYEKKIFNILDSLDKLRNNTEINHWDKYRAINRKKIKLALIPVSLILLVILVYSILSSKLKEIATTSDSSVVAFISLGLTFAMFLSIIYGIIYIYKKIKKYGKIKKNNRKNL
ncbi:Plasmodium exported protein, unknown function [Plasmodium malariae]|uniref:Uncharacterized protein n=1 Tax=Plasmodium malariae TaxID=5858 RepID=A0A1D3JKG7_PLAMA|nr:Plasmodium exported protein, unknown function [Plasmodium malariae]SBT87039.1 Plasmodium exported protein, unknown function [Plasmodium malariae]